MDQQKAKKVRQLRRRRHVRSKITGTPQRPRLSVFRSSKHIYAQLIDDLNGVTVAAASSTGKDTGLKHGSNVKAATEVGKKLAEAANAAGLICCEPKPRKKAKLAAAAAAAPAKAAKGEKAAAAPKEKKEKKEKKEAPKAAE